MADESYGALMRANGIEAQLLQWRAAVVKRNRLIREAGAAGFSVNRISVLSGVSRQTVTRILDGDPRAERQAPK